MIAGPTGRAAAAAVLLALGLGVAAGPGRAAGPAGGAKVERTDRAETRKLAAEFLARLKVEELTRDTVRATRAGAVVMLQRGGKTEQQAGEIFDEFLLPEFLARMPELAQRFEDILAEDFTAAELRSVLDNKQDAARRSAVGKVPKMQADFTKAGQDWGGQVGRDAYAKNKTALQKLGLD